VPNVNGLIEQLDGKLEFKRELLRAQVFNVNKSPAATAYAEAVDVLATLCWLFPEAMIQKLDALLGTDRKGALMPEERQRRQAEGNAALQAAETELAEAVWMAQEKGLPFEHDPGCSFPALAILGLRLGTAPRALPAPAGLIHSYDIVGR
jgi:hypothetical protein